MSKQPTALVLRHTLMGRAVGWVLRRMHIVTDPTEFSAGADFTPEIAATPGFPSLASMAAFGEFAWVAACATIVSSDLASLPLVVWRKVGDETVRVDDHPILELFEQPGTRTDGMTFREQQWVDFFLEGNSYTLELAGLQTMLQRLHPARTTIIPTKDGQPELYQFDGAGETTRYPWEIVYQMRTSSWEDTPAGLYGQGWIRALKRDLSADLAAQKRNAQASARGGPEFIVGPEGEDAYWPEKLTKAIRGRIDELFNGVRAGAAVFGRPLKVEQLSWTPKDMEYMQQRTWVRDTIMAISGVPPIRLGLETANYATAQMQDKTYWQKRVADAAHFDRVFSRLAGKMGQPGDRVRHDFSAIEALQESRTDRLGRVVIHIENGIEANEAYKFEGFDDAPFAAGRGSSHLEDEGSSHREEDKGMAAK